MKNFLLIFISIYFLSCSSNHQIHINSDDSATVNFSVVNKNSLAKKLTEWEEVLNIDSIINVVQIRKDLESDNNISKVKMSSLSKNNYNGNFSVTDIDNLFSDPTAPQELKIFSLSESGGSKTLKIKITLENYARLKESIPFLKEDVINMLGPEENRGISKEEYLDMMSFSFEERGPQDLLDSIVELEISVDGKIINIECGNKLSNNSAIFKVPLIDIILLKKRLIYSLTYR